MNNSTSTSCNRRVFLKSTLLASTAFATLPFNAPAPAALTKPAATPDRGLKLGITSYTLRKFSLDQAIDMTRRAGLRYISLKDMHLPLNSSAKDLEGARKKIEAAGLQLLGCGVVYLKNSQTEIRAAFDYAKNAGTPTLICAPDPDALDFIETSARQYDIRIAIHNHGPDNNQYPSPLDVLRLVKDRDPRLGICMDVGHTVRLGQDPVAVLQQCAPRLYDFHIKDVTEASARGATTEMGRGVIDLVPVLKALADMRYSHHVALEYEANPDDPMPGILESVGYMRGVLAATA